MWERLWLYLQWLIGQTHSVGIFCNTLSIPKTKAQIFNSFRQSLTLYQYFTLWQCTNNPNNPIVRIKFYYYLLHLTPLYMSFASYLYSSSSAFLAITVLRWLRNKLVFVAFFGGFLLRSHLRKKILQFLVGFSTNPTDSYVHNLTVWN